MSAGAASHVLEFAVVTFAKDVVLDCSGITRKRRKKSVSDPSAHLACEEVTELPFPKILW